MKKVSRILPLEAGWSLELEDKTSLKIEMSEIKNLTPLEIGERAKKWINDAEVIQLKFDAQRFTLEYKDAKPSLVLKGLEVCKSIIDRVQQFEPEEREQLLKSHELSFMKSVAQMLRQKAIVLGSRARDKAAREYVGRRYSTIFLEIAKERGFKCEHCGANNDLLLYPTKTAERDNPETRIKVENLLIVCGNCFWDKGFNYGTNELKAKQATN